MPNDRLALVLALYLGAASLILFALMGIDKRHARTGGRRVPERTLFLFALLGGALGGAAGMLAFRHKTKHASFMMGMPLILVLNLALAFFVLYLNAMM